MSLDEKNNVKISASMMCIDWLNAGNQLSTLEKVENLSTFNLEK